MFKKLGLYYRTVKHLKPIQVWYRLWYMLRNRLRKLTGHSYPFSIPKEGNKLNLEPGLPKPASCNLQPATSLVSFTFLNKQHTFEGAIDWNIETHGKLWAYNLNYFEYLHQEGMTSDEGLQLIREFVDAIEANKEGLEPYPISLRGINWIKFLSQHDIQDKEIDASLYAQYQILLDNLEYHLLGNHLLENGCSLLFGAFYFQDQELYSKAKEILSDELEEQVLSDGAHFERSTMYHCILLERLMDCCNVVKGSQWFEDEELEELLRDKTELMLGWLRQLTVNSEQLKLPLLNDAAGGIGPELSELFDYADRLGLQSKQVELGESGYRRYSTDTLDLICDVGNIGPDYQPGHAHSDTLSFVLYADGQPMIIDPGISTYENNDRRQLERSTEFHNTVQAEGMEQSEVWSAFRVGRRAKVEVQAEDGGNLVASHDGYQPWGVTHQRSWQVEKNSIRIEDRLEGGPNKTGSFNLHLDPKWGNEIQLTRKNRIAVGNLIISFEGHENVKKQSYGCPNGYNRYIKAVKITTRFVGSLTTIITIAS